MKIAKFQRLSAKDKDRIKKLTFEGKSLNQIVDLTGLNKNTIYYNVLKFKPKINREVYIDAISNKQLGELMGAFAGDGSYYHQNYSSLKKNSTQHRIRYHLSLKDDLDYAHHLLVLLRKINLNPFVIKDAESSRLDISLSSKSFYELIKKHLTWNGNKTFSIRLRKDMGSYDKKFLAGFARGLMDTDGYVEISNVSVACISEGLIKDMAKILNKYNLRYKLSKKLREGRQILYLIRVYRDSLEKYAKLIGFSNFYKAEALRKILNKSNRKG